MWLFYGRNFERGDDPGQALREAQQAFDDFSRELGELDIDEMDLGHLQNRIVSATELIGPDDSPAAFLRRYVENATSQHSELIWPESVLGRPCALVDAVVHFGDGTTVTLEAESAPVDFHDGSFMGFDYRVDEDSVTGLDESRSQPGRESTNPDGNGSDSQHQFPR